MEAPGRAIYCPCEFLVCGKAAARGAQCSEVTLLEGYLGIPSNKLKIQRR